MSEVNPNPEIPRYGPFIYDLSNNVVRNVSIKMTMEGWAIKGQPTGDRSATVLSIETTEEPTIEIKLTYGYGTKYEEEFTDTVTDPQHVVNLSLIGDSLLSINWQDYNGYPVLTWIIPLHDIVLITVNKT